MLHTDKPVPCNSTVPVETWFSTEPDDVAVAKELCRGCMSKLDCLEDALELEAMLGTQLKGVHGGLTPAERANIKSVRRIA